MQHFGIQSEAKCEVFYAILTFELRSCVFDSRAETEYLVLNVKMQ